MKYVRKYSESRVVNNKLDNGLVTVDLNNENTKQFYLGLLKFSNTKKIVDELGLGMI
jgi:hypothetical protein